jgi:hypothetical protein
MVFVSSVNFRFLASPPTMLSTSQRIESVIMRYGCFELDNVPVGHEQKTVERNGKKEFRSNPRATLCVSSQVSCADLRRRFTRRPCRLAAQWGVHSVQQAQWVYWPI